jgi:hypothetical protein
MVPSMINVDYEADMRLDNEVAAWMATDDYHDFMDRYNRQQQELIDHIHFDFEHLLIDRNGLVVDYNPLLTTLFGCNTNALLFLGAKEQSRGALFYIGPYINKNGVGLIDALPLLLKAQEDVLLHPSVAEDSGTQKRNVQHTLTRTLNKLNSQMEVSDTQAAGALLMRLID